MVRVSATTAQYSAQSNPITLVGASQSMLSTTNTVTTPLSAPIVNVNNAAIPSTPVIIAPSISQQQQSHQLANTNHQVASIPTLVSTPMTITTKQIKSSAVVTSIPSSFTATSQHALRVVTGTTTAAAASASNTPIRVLSSGQTVRLATSQTGATILRGQTSIMTTSITPGTVGTTTTSATIGGKQILLQKPINLSGQNFMQLVKTSQGMTVVQKPLQAKTALIGANVVKLMTPAAVSGNKIVMKNSNLMQVGKMTTNAAGKPAFVITNKQGQQIRTNQQIIFVTTAGAIRTVQTGNIVTSAANNFVSLVTTSYMNTITSATATGMNSVASIQSPSGGTVKMIRGVSGVGKPITFTLPVQTAKTTGGQQIISMPQKGLTIGGKAVTVQLAPGAGGQKTVTILSSAAASSVQKSSSNSNITSGGVSNDIQGHKILMMPSKRSLTNVITHKSIPISTSNIPNETITTDSGLSAPPITTETSLMETERLESEQQIEQMDGANDINLDDDDTSNSTDEYDPDDILNTSTCKRKISVCKKKNYNKKIKIDQPRFVKLGLYGGAPPTTAVTVSSTTSGQEIMETDESSIMGMTPELTDSNNLIEGSTVNTTITTTSSSYTTADDSNKIDVGTKIQNQQNTITALDDHQMINASASKTHCDANDNDTNIIEGSISGDGSDAGAANNDVCATEISGGFLNNSNDEFGNQYGSNDIGSQLTQQLQESDTCNNVNRMEITEPTASETEAANILTIIKSGELLLSRPSDNQNIDSGSSGPDNGPASAKSGSTEIIPTTSFSTSGQITSTRSSTVSNSIDGNVTILFNNEPHNNLASITTSSVTSQNQLKPQQKQQTIHLQQKHPISQPQSAQKNILFSSHTGHLDALASAALQASSNAQKQEYIIASDVAAAVTTSSSNSSVSNSDQNVTTTSGVAISQSTTQKKGVLRHRRTTIGEHNDEVCL